MKPQIYQKRPATIEVFYCEKAGEYDLDGTVHRTTRDDIFVLQEGDHFVERSGESFRREWVYFNVVGR